MRGNSRPYGDIMVAVFVLCVASLLLVPLPTTLLDFLIAFNIAFSLLLLLIGLSLQSALSLLTFPTLLLLSTLFRLSLNVASTRLILSQGEAGDVIGSFGSFLISGELAVGIIIFLIITVVNFVVIARGSGRVSEVAARFVLDSLPGKQLAIDSDLRSGLISAEEAKTKREDLRKEAQLFGSMDGAVKFVQGDAIAGMFIIFVNIFGGIYLGVKNGLSFEDAVQTYTMLTIGDGLVTQIPALLVSICAGVVVTRVSSGRDATLGSDISIQLLRDKKIIYLASLMVLCLGFFPGIPLFPFFIASLGLMFAGIYVRKMPEETWAVNREVRELGSRIGTSETLSIDYEESRLEIFVSSILYSNYQSSSKSYHDYWKMLQVNEKNDSGLKIPSCIVRLDSKLTASEYYIKDNSFELKRGKVPLGCNLFLLSESHIKEFGLKVEEKGFDPLTKFESVWIRDSEYSVKLKVDSELESYDAVQYIFIEAYSYYKENPGELVNITDTHLALKEIESHYPGLFSSLFEENFLNPARITEILKALYSSNYKSSGIKDILEVLSLYCSHYGAELVKENEFVLNDIVGFIRSQRKRNVVSAYVDNLSSIKGIYVDPMIVQDIAKSNQINDDGLLRQSATRLCSDIKKKCIKNVVMIVPEQIRNKVESLLSKASLDMNVISYSEIPKGVNIEYIESWNRI